MLRADKKRYSGPFTQLILKLVAVLGAFAFEFAFIARESQMAYYRDVDGSEEFTILNSILFAPTLFVFPIVMIIMMFFPKSITQKKRRE